MILGPPNFYDDGIRPAQLRYPHARPKATPAPEPALPPPPADEHRLRILVRVVCIAKGVKPADFLSPRRDTAFVEARHLYHYLARELTPHSYTQIGRRSGGQHHKTVMHGCRKIKSNMDKHDRTITAIKKLLGIE